MVERIPHGYAVRLARNALIAHLVLSPVLSPESAPEKLIHTAPRHPEPPGDLRHRLAGVVELDYLAPKLCPSLR